jgi:hypothetical protein
VQQQQHPVHGVFRLLVLELGGRFRTGSFGARRVGQRVVLRSSIGFRTGFRTGFGWRVVVLGSGLGWSLDRRRRGQR